jgi:hypothetical protein
MCHQGGPGKIAESWPLNFEIALIRQWLSPLDGWNSKPHKGCVPKELNAKAERSGAPKGTILELFSKSMCQVCQRLLSLRC